MTNSNGTEIISPQKFPNFEIKSRAIIFFSVVDGKNVRIYTVLRISIKRRIKNPQKKRLIVFFELIKLNSFLQNS